jgi:hypothetical protein
MEIEGACGGILGKTPGTVFPMEEEESGAIQGDNESTHETASIEDFHADEVSEAEGSQVCYGFRAYVDEEVDEGFVYRQSSLAGACEAIEVVQHLQIGVPEVVIELAAATQLE